MRVAVTYERIEKRLRSPPTNDGLINHQSENLNLFINPTIRSARIIHVDVVAIINVRIYTSRNVCTVMGVRNVNGSS